MHDAERASKILVGRWRVVWATVIVFAAASAATVWAELSDPHQGTFASLVGVFASVVTIGAIAMAVLIYFLQSSESSRVTESLKKFIESSLNSAAANRGQLAQRHQDLDQTVGVVRGRKVLWVDDQPRNNIFETNALRGSGATITFVLSTRDAEAALLTNQFDLVITDMKRPEGDEAGLETLSFVKQHFPTTPVIIYSSRAEPHQVARAMSAGALTQVADPWSLYRDAITAMQGHGASR